ncbi:MAG TPA: proteasome accessory factor PafA2 family protein [Candidatus Saccharimonadales bacterium]|nr:proteasome accessory factor PafA2 family protein [Candidatus Saccharimonadales bacterium]
MYLENRVFGTDVEYGISERYIGNKNGGQRDIAPSTIETVLRDFIPDKRVGQWTVNGSRYYQDHAHAEGCTPEVDSIVDGLAHERIIERKIRNAFEAWEQGPGKGRVVTVTKGTSDGVRLWGAHNSIQSEREAWSAYGHSDPEYVMNHPAFKLLGMFLGSCDIFLGSGAIVGDLDEDYKLSLSERGALLTHDVHMDTVDRKPVLNMRDEALGNQERFVRLHVVKLDANLSDWAQLMKWGMLMLIAGCAEEKIFPGWEDLDLRTGDLKNLSRHVALDTTCSQPFTFAAGQTMTAVDIQEQIYQAAIDLSERVDVGDELRWVLDEWGKAIVDVRQSPLLLRNRVDWGVHHQMIGRKLEEYGNEPDEANLTGLAHRRVRAVSVGFRQLTTKRVNKAGQPVPDGPTALRTSEKGWGGYEPLRQLLKQRRFEKLVAERESSPPPTTRARLRGEFINRLADRGDISVRDWDSAAVYIKNYCGAVHFPDDPRVSEVPGFSALLDEILRAEAMTYELAKKLGITASASEFRSGLAI